MIVSTSPAARSAVRSEPGAACPRTTATACSAPVSAETSCAALAFGRQVLGCVMDPPAMDAYASGQACFTTIYEERIQKVLDEALRRQRYFLRHSLVSAYVRADFDAFRDVKIRDALISARKILLEHPDRMLVELADVADDEPGVPTGDGKLWKAQLRARGVKEKHPLMGGAGRLADRPPGTLVPPREPPPKVPIYEGPLAWGELTAGPAERPLAGEDRRSNRGGAPARRRRVGCGARRSACAVRAALARREGRVRSACRAGSVR
jgi:hypothetical protein